MTLPSLIIYISIFDCPKFNRDGKKLTKLHTQICGSEKLAYKICAKNAPNRSKLAKMSKIAQKSQKPFSKYAWKKKQHYHSCEKLAHAARARRASFAISEV